MTEVPDFFILNPYFSSDPYFSSQWGLKNTGQYGSPGIDINIEPAWNITERSSNITVAIIDTGVYDFAFGYNYVVHYFAAIYPKFDSKLSVLWREYNHHADE